MATAGESAAPRNPLQQHEEQLVFPLRGSLENVFVGVSMMLLGIAGYAALGVFSTHAAPWGITAGTMGLFFLIMGLQTRSAYVLDAPREQLLFVRSIFQYNFQRVVCDFQSLFAASAGGVRRSSKYDAWWEYCPVLILRDRRALRIGPLRKKDYQGANVIAKTVATSLDIPCLVMPPETTLKVSVNPAGPDPLVVHRKHSHWRAVLLTVLAAAAFAGFMIYILNRR